MSSLLRRIQKRRLKSIGFSRNEKGLIVDANGTVYGRHYPKDIPTERKLKQ